MIMMIMSSTPMISLIIMSRDDDDDDDPPSPPNVLIHLVQKLNLLVFSFSYTSLSPTPPLLMYPKLVTVNQNIIIICCCSWW